MTAKTALIHVRVDAELKEGAAAVLAEYGLTVSDVVRIVLTRIANEGGVPPYLLASADQYDAWFREKVREAMDDSRPRIPHAEATARLREILDQRAREGQVSE